MARGAPLQSTISYLLPAAFSPSCSYAPTRVVDDVLDNTTDVTVLLSEVQSTKPGRVLAVAGVGLEDTTRLSLVEDNALQRGSIPSLLSIQPCDVHPFLLMLATDGDDSSTHCLEDAQQPSHAANLVNHHFFAATKTPRRYLPIHISATELAKVALSVFPTSQAEAAGSVL